MNMYELIKGRKQVACPAALLLIRTSHRLMMRRTHFKIVAVEEETCQAPNLPTTKGGGLHA